VAPSFWAELHTRFDPADESRAVEEGWTVERPPEGGWDLPVLLRREVEDRRFLVTGSVGTGKSTELLRAVASSGDHSLGVYLDVHRHFTLTVRDAAAIDRLQPWELVFLAGLAVARTGSDVFNHPWDQAALDRLLRAYQDLTPGPAEPENRPTLDIAAAIQATTVVVADAAAPGLGQAAMSVLKVLAGAVEGWKIPLAARKPESPLPDQKETVRALIEAVNDLIGTLQEKYRPILLVVDGLDRIEDPETRRGMFVESQLLAQLASARLVVTAPLELRDSGEAMRALGVRAKPLPNLPVLEKANPGRYGEGISFFLDVFRGRLRGSGAPPGCVPDDILRELAYYSGGRVREFIRLVRLLSARESGAGHQEACREHALQVIDEVRRLAEAGLRKQDFHVLEGIAGDEESEHSLPTDDAVDRLLERHALIPYPNESEWYYPHPLLTIRKVKPHRPPFSV
jgi:hypothetical protein